MIISGIALPSKKKGKISREQRVRLTRGLSWPSSASGKTTLSHAWLDSFFWMLFWIGFHCPGPDENRVIPQFDKWNYVYMEELAK